MGLIINHGSSVRAAPDPNRKPAGRRVSRADFVRRFTDAELAGIIAAGRSQPAVQVFIERLRLGGDVVDLDSPFVSVGLGGLESRGVLSAERAAELGA